MKTSALRKYFLLTIALNFLFFINILQAGTKTEIGQATEAILGAPYGPFATQEETETHIKASCISSVIYGLRAIGFKCPYRDFKVYYRVLSKEAGNLELGKTKMDSMGLVLFNGRHFALLYEDVNDDGVIDSQDKIIHALFHPVKISTLAEWLEKDPARPIRYIYLSNGIPCPQ